jgi:hypothetical protein
MRQDGGRAWDEEPHRLGSPQRGAAVEEGEEALGVVGWEAPAEVGGKLGGQLLQAHGDDAAVLAVAKLFGRHVQPRHHDAGEGLVVGGGGGGGRVHERSIGRGGGGSLAEV